MKPGQTTHLIGKGGVGLAMFHMARLGHEFIQTTDSSHSGDLWVEFDSKREAVEVKTSTKNTWIIRTEQAKRVDRIIFVNMTSCGAWIVSSEKLILELEKPSKQLKQSIVVSVSFIESIADVALHRQTNPIAVQRKRNRPDHVTGKWTVVRKRLASGEERVYRYPRW